MYEIETDTPIERVELDYVTTEHEWMSTRPFRNSNELTTVYDDRQEGFAESLAEIGQEVAEAYGATIEVAPYEEHTTHYGRFLAQKIDTEGMRVTITGSAEAIEDMMISVAAEGHGLTQYRSVLADWRHPVQSVKGFWTALQAHKVLEDCVKEEAEVADDVRHVRYVPT